MNSMLASFVFAGGSMNRLVTYGFLLAAVPLLGFVLLDLRRAARESAEKKKGSMKFMSRYRDEHGMPIFFEVGEDPSARAAQRVLRQKQRTGASAFAGDESGR